MASPHRRRARREKRNAPRIVVSMAHQVHFHDRPTIDGRKAWAIALLNSGGAEEVAVWVGR